MSTPRPIKQRVHAFKYLASHVPAAGCRERVVIDLTQSRDRSGAEEYLVQTYMAVLRVLNLMSTSIL